MPVIHLPNATAGGCDGGVPPLSVTVNWGSDGSATVNGEQCVANCFGDAGSQPCGPQGLPVPSQDPRLGCVADLTCTTGSIEYVEFYATATNPTINVVTPRAGCQYSPEAP